MKVKWWSKDSQLGVARQLPSSGAHCCKLIWLGCPSQHACTAPGVLVAAAGSDPEDHKVPSCLLCQYHCYYCYHELKLSIMIGQLLWLTIIVVIIKNIINTISILIVIGGKFNATTIVHLDYSEGTAAALPFGMLLWLWNFKTCLSRSNST